MHLIKVNFKILREKKFDSHIHRFYRDWHIYICTFGLFAENFPSAHVARIHTYVFIFVGIGKCGRYFMNSISFESLITRRVRIEHSRQMKHILSALLDTRLMD